MPTIIGLDTNTILLIVYVLLILGLLAMALLIHPMFGVFSGVVTFFFALFIYSTTGNSIVTFLVGGFGALLITGSLLIDTNRGGKRLLG